MPSVNNPDPDFTACKYPIQSKDEKTLKKTDKVTTGRLTFKD